MFIAAVSLTLTNCLLVSSPRAGANQPAVSFHKQLRPILQRHCVGCHQPAKNGGGLLLTRYELLMRGGKDGPAVVAGKPDEGSLVAALLGKDQTLMPKEGEPLAKSQIELFRQWIAQGAKDDSPPSVPDAIDADHPPVYQGRPLITALAYSNDGTTLAVGGYREILLHKGDGSGIKGRLVGLSQRIEALAYSPDGSTLAAVGGSPGRFGELQLWEVKTNKLARSMLLTNDTIFGVNWSSDNTRVAFGVADNSTRIVEVKTGKQMLKIDHHTDWVLGAAFSRDNQYLVTVSRDRAVKLTQTATGAFIDNITSITPNALAGGVETVDRHPKEDQFAVGGVDTPPRIYRMLRVQARQIGDDFNLIRAFEPLAGKVSCVRFNPDGALLAAAGPGEARVYQVADGKRLASVKFDGGVYALAFHPTNGSLAAGGYEGIVRIIEAKTGKVLKEFVPVPFVEPRVAAGIAR